MRNRGRTEQKIIDAVSKIVNEKDFDALGINAIAEEAGVGKVLIYRYFGDFEGLLREWALHSHYWPSQVEGGSPDFSKQSLPEVKEEAENIFSGQLKIMYENPQLRKIIRWHLASGNPVSKEIMAQVEKDGMILMDAFKSRCDPDQNLNLDLDALISLIIGGIYYLSVISDQADVFNSIPLNLPEGQKRLKNGISQWIEMLF